MLRYGCAACSIAVLLSCASDSELGKPPRLASAHDDSSSAAESHTVSVYLVADNLSGYSPEYSDRVLLAEPVVQLVSRQARARRVVQGIDTIVIGDSCSELHQRYSDLISCELSETVAPHYQEPVASATTDSEGFAAFNLGQGSYRISLQSWHTLEDSACYWGGSTLVADQQTSVGISLMVFCE